MTFWEFQGVPPFFHKVFKFALRVLHMSLVEHYPSFCGDFWYEYSDEIVRYVFQLFESYTTFSHIEFSDISFFIFILPPLHKSWFDIYPHVIEIHAIFLACNRYERKWQLWVTVISSRVEWVWYDVPDHPIAHHFFESLWDIFLYHTPKFRDDFHSFGRQSWDILIRSLGKYLHIFRVRLFFIILNI